MANTTNFGWTKPTVSGSTDTWGTILNAVFDAVDAELFAPAVTNSQNGASIVQWTNANAGVSATVSYRLSNDASHAMALQLYGSGYTPTAAYDFADSVNLIANGNVGGMNFATIGGAFPIRWFTNSVERMHLDGSGNLGIGKTAPTTILDIVQSGANQESVIQLLNANAGNNTATRLRLDNGTSVAQVIQLGLNFAASGINRADGTLIAGTGAGGVTINAQAVQPIYFGINSVEKMRLDVNGNLLVANTAQLSTEKFQVLQGAAGSVTVRFANSHASPSSAVLVGATFINGAPNDSSSEFLQCADSSTLRAAMYANGGLASYSANNVNLSDVRVKDGFSPYTDEDLIGLEAGFVRVDWGRFKYNDQTHGDWNHGYTAQGVAVAFSNTAPELVDDVELGPKDMIGLKGVYETDLNNISHALLARALKRIEQLETQIARLTHG